MVEIDTVKRNGTFARLVSSKKIGFIGAIALLFNAATVQGDNDRDQAFPLHQKTLIALVTYLQYPHSFCLHLSRDSLFCLLLKPCKQFQGISIFKGM